MIEKGNQPKEYAASAYHQVVSNQGSAGVDDMQVTELMEYLT